MTYWGYPSPEDSAYKKFINHCREEYSRARQCINAIRRAGFQKKRDDIYIYSEVETIDEMEYNEDIERFVPGFKQVRWLHHLEDGTTNHD